jgi:hypothetical protein
MVINRGNTGNNRRCGTGEGQEAGQGRRTGTADRGRNMGRNRGGTGEGQGDSVPVPCPTVPHTRPSFSYQPHIAFTMLPNKNIIVLLSFLHLKIRLKLGGTGI